MASDAAFSDAVKDVTKRFATPHAVIECDDFSHEQKVKLLQQWEQDLRLEMVATEENMPGQRPGQGLGGAAETFRKVRDALKRLGVGENDKPPAAGKAG